MTPTKAIYRALPSTGHREGALFMLKSDDYRVTGPAKGGYERVAGGQLTDETVRFPGMAHAGKLFVGDDNQLYVVYSDWSVSLFTIHRLEST